MKATEARALASKFKQAIKDVGDCSIEIRCPMGNPTGERLQQSLGIAGMTANLVKVVATPPTGILIESSQQCAGIALSIQTAFRAVNMEAHLLVQNAPRPEIIVIHLNSPEPSKTAARARP